MKKIVILYFDSTPLSSVALPLDIFLATGVTWNRHTNQPINKQFEVTITTPDGNAAQCQGNLGLKPHCAMVEVKEADVVIISPIIPTTLHQEISPKVVPWLIKMHEKGSVLASICTGSFILADTGLLDNKIATTHWAAANTFKDEFPKVTVQAQSTVTDNGNILCSGGANAGADLCMHLIRKFGSNELAFQCAKSLLIDPRRHSQSPYQTFNFDKSHGDQTISSMQEWIEQNYTRSFTVDTLAEKAYMSRRTFERRFRKSTGDSPLQYIQKVRVESAKVLLEICDNGFEEITTKVGYEDSSTFRKIFIKFAGITPGQYREKFKT